MKHSNQPPAGQLTLVKPPRPVALSVDVSGIPDELKKYPNWALWRYHWSRDKHKWTKPPFLPNGRMKRDGESSSRFEEVLRAYKTGQFDGIGFVLDGTPFAGVDLDDCLNKPWALDIINVLDSFSEVTPSGNGYHVLVRATLPPHTRNKSRNFHNAKAEIYDHARYLTVTGQVVPGFPSVIYKRQNEIEKIFAPLMQNESIPTVEYSGNKNVETGNNTVCIDSNEIIKRGEKVFKNKFSELFFNGNSGGDHSADDLSLCNMLAFLTGKNPDLMDEVFRKSALMRPKWDERRGSTDYGQMTIHKALADCQRVYQEITPVEVSRADEKALPRGGEDDFQAFISYPDIKRSQSGKVRPLNTADNLSTLCKALCINPRYNKMTMEVELGGIQTGFNEAGAQIRSFLISEAEKTGLPKISIDDHLTAIACRHDYHPAAQWLEDGPRWDGKHRLREVIACFNFDEPQHALGVMRKFFVSCMGALYAGQFSTKITPVLQGPQSYMKTAAIRRICSIPIEGQNTFLEGASLDPSDKDSLKKCIKHWVVELGELESTTKKCASQLKAFLTNNRDELRLPYAKTETKKPRQTVFIGSVNGSGFLRDPTGSTRFQALSMAAHVDIDRLNAILGYEWTGSEARLVDDEPLRQFWLEVKALYDAGHGWTLTADEQEFSLEQNSGFTPSLPFQDDIEALVTGGKCDHFYTASEVGERLFICNSNATALKQLHITLSAMYGKMHRLRLPNGQRKRCYKMPRLIPPL